MGLGYMPDPPSTVYDPAKRCVKVLSPFPAAESEPIPQVVASQVPARLTTVELTVNMHCEACAQQLKRKILRMKGTSCRALED